jgi:hypothetical protein
LDPYPGCDIDPKSGTLTTKGAVPGTVTVRAVSEADPSKTGEAQVTVVSGQPEARNVVITAEAPVMRHGETEYFNAVVGGTAGNTGVTWEVAAGVSDNTAFAAGGRALTVGEDEASPVLWVTARSARDPRVSAQTIVRVPTVDEVVAAPGSAAVAKGGQLQFYAAVTGSHLEAGDQAVRWELEGSVNNVSTINTAGLLTVGTNETAEALTVRAVSAYDGSKFSTAGVAVKAVQAAVFNYVEATNTNDTTSKLTLFFDRDIPGGLVAGDIQITPVGADGGTVTTGAVSKLANTTGVYEIPVTGVTKGGAVEVAAVKAGVNSNALSATVTRTVLFTGVTAESTNGVTTKLVLQFNADIAGFALADITLEGGVATKGSALTAKGSGTYELAVNATKFGTATV